MRAKSLIIFHIRVCSVIVVTVLITKEHSPRNLDPIVTFNIATQCLTDTLSETALQTQYFHETHNCFRHAAADHEDGRCEPGHADLPVPGAGEGAEGEELPDRPTVLLRADRCE